jgi:hypothetical protein
LFIFDVGSISNIWSPWRIAYYVLLLLAPALTFVPVGLRLEWPFFGPYAVLGWAGLGYVLAFVPLPEEVSAEAVAGPVVPETLLLIWYIFPLIFVVSTTILAPLAYAVGLKLFTSRTHQRDLLRAWREAGLLSIYLVGLAIGRSLGLLSWPIALLSLLFLALVEALFLARKGGEIREQSQRPFE